VKQRFNEVAPIYDTLFPPHISQHLFTERLRLIKKYLSPPAKILDAGCGTGILLSRLLAEGYDAWGIDLSASMIKIARRRIPERAMKGDLAKIPYPDHTFDGVISIATLHHLDKSFSKALYEMARILKPGGVILLWDHNSLNPYWRILMNKVPQDTGKEVIFSDKQIVRELRKNKIRILLNCKKGFLPDFAPLSLMPLFLFFEKGLQCLPIFHHFLSHTVIVGEKNNVEQ
jgi:ubiquinone/menaquinone biosynthesis C-methylase UbiE